MKLWAFSLPGAQISAAEADTHTAEAVVFPFFLKRFLAPCNRHMDRTAFFVYISMGHVPLQP